MLFEFKLAVITSGLPSPLRSAIATEYGLIASVPRLKVLGAPKPPAPFPSSTVTLFEPMLAVTTSGLPSRLISPTAADTGLAPLTFRMIVLGVPKVGIEHEKALGE